MRERDWSDRLNPVLVKEIRQYFHNRFILVVMGALLLLQLLLLCLTQLEMGNRDTGEIERGGPMFAMVAAALGLGGILICGVGSLLRFSAERSNPELDFSCTTTLGANRIVFGKLLGALVMAVFLYALCLPFIVISYFLRGISMADMLTWAVMLFPVLLLSAQAGILVGAAGKRWLNAVYFLGLLQMLMPLSSMFLFLLNPYFSGRSQALAVLFWSVTPVLLAIGLFYVLSVAAVGHVASNRMLLPRLYLVGVFLLSPLGGLIVCWYGGYSGVPAAAAALSLVVCGMPVVSMLATLACFERENAGKRVVRHCPASLPGRMGFFLISSGMGGGILSAWLLLALMAGAGALAVFIDPDFRRSLEVLVGDACYFIAYAELAIWWRPRFRRLPGWGCWLLIVGVFAVAPAIIAGMFHAVLGEMEPLLLTTPLFPAAYDDAMIGWLAPLVFAALGFGLVAGRILDSFRAFRRDGKENET